MGVYEYSGVYCDSVQRVELCGAGCWAYAEAGWDLDGDAQFGDWYWETCCWAGFGSLWEDTGRSIYHAGVCGVGLCDLDSGDVVWRFDFLLACQWRDIGW